MFLDLFYGLRDAGVPVAVQEWMMLMRAMAMGQHGSSLAGFYHVSRACLVKSESNFDLFDAVFGSIYGDVEGELEVTDELLEWLKDPKDFEGMTDEERAMLEELSRDDLLRRFRAAGNAVLLGTGSFWEGVDVRGTSLTVVAIDALPFTSPADPLLMARLEYIRRTGGNGFAEHQLPQAALAMKQGAGRLLRDDADYGVIVLCDPRITSRNYGSTFLKILEPMRTTRSLDDVRRFFERHESKGAVA